VFLFNKFKKIKNDFFLKNNLSWFERYIIWQYSYFSIFFDDLFAIIFKKISKNFFLIPGFYFFDKYISYWNSYNFFKKKFYSVSFKIFLEKNNTSFFILYIISFFCIFIIGLLLLYLVV